MLYVSYRFDVGPPAFQTMFFKIYIGCTYAMFWFGNAVTLTGFLQAVIWKRVMEINEELASAIVTRSIIVVCFSLGLLCHPEYKLFAVISVLKGTRVNLPLAACIDGIDPLHQK